MLRIFFVLSLLLACWLWMQIVHELGHVLGAVLTQGTVQQVELHPLIISRTDVQGSTQPLVVIWLGPICGCLAPLLTWWMAAATKWPGAFVSRFFAGFCLLANGLYLAAGSFDGVGDCGELLRHGAPIWSLWLFGLLTIPPGFWLWHRQADDFGIGEKGKEVSPAFSFGVIAFAAITVLLELLYSRF